MLLYSPCLNCHSFLWWYVVFSSESESVQVFFIICLCMYWGQRSSYQKGRVWTLLNSLTMSHFLYLSQTRTWISNVICHGLLCSASSVKMRWLFVLLILVELMTITVYNFLFINWFIIWLSLLKFLNLLLNVVYVYVFITCPARPLV
jgi:hypothetical protein